MVSSYGRRIIVDGADGRKAGARSLFPRGRFQGMDGSARSRGGPAKRDDVPGPGTPCTSCGKTFAAGVLVCPFCGQRRPSADAGAAPVSTPSAVSPGVRATPLPVMVTPVQPRLTPAPPPGTPAAAIRTTPTPGVRTTPRPIGRATPLPPGTMGAQCYKCSAPIRSETGVCGRCGWDGPRARRSCLKCGSLVTLNVAALPLSVQAVLIVLSTVAAGVLAGLKAVLAVSAGLLALATAVYAQGVSYRCENCGRVVPPRVVSPAERDELARERWRYRAGALVAAVLAAAASTWWVAGYLSGPRSGLTTAQLEARGVKGVPGLIRALPYDNLENDFAATRALGRIGRPAVPALAKALGDRRPEVRFGAASALRSIAPNVEPALPAIIRALDDELAGVRWCAAEALGTLGVKAEGAVAALARHVNDVDLGTRSSSIKALAGMGPGAAPALAPLTAALGDREASVRAAAAQALGMVGRAAATAAPQLQRLQADPDHQVADAAKRALEKIGP
ncbi:MAG: HEAT repeat domain-containing protein [Deltaproteobacteria bacterium]|nr:HEAT repeat domain-containing protein [Deltaproteobacteria bacterium]